MVNFKKAGYVFEDDVRRGLELEATWFIKFPDTKMLGFINQRSKQLGMHPIMFPKAPCDFIAIDDNAVTYFLEAKNTYQKTFKILAAIKEHQLLEGCTLDDIGTHVRHYFIINMKNFKRVFAVKPVDLLTFLKTHKKSCTVEDFEQIGIELHRLTASKHPSGDGAFISFERIFNKNGNN